MSELSEAAEQARDAIIDHLLEGNPNAATHIYMEITGKDYLDAYNVIHELDGVLHRPGLTTPREETFLEGFRASLMTPAPPRPTEPRPTPKIRALTPTAEPPPSSPPNLPRRIRQPSNAHRARQEPEETPPPGILPVLLYTPLAHLTLLAALAAFTLFFGILGHYLNFWLIMVPAMVVGVFGLMAFSFLVSEVSKALRIQRWLRSPGFLFDIGLGIAFLSLGLIGAYTVERWLWANNAETVPIPDPTSLVTGAGRQARLMSDAVYEMPSVAVLPGPLGVIKKRRSHGAKQGGSYIEYWRVLPLVPNNRRAVPGGDHSLPGDLPSCLWLGWRSTPGYSSGFDSIDDSLSPSKPSDFYIRAHSETTYRRAVANALKVRDAPECITILNRVPPLEEILEAQQRQIGILLIIANLLPWGFLLIAGVAAVYERIKSLATGRRQA